RRPKQMVAAIPLPPARPVEPARIETAQADPEPTGSLGEQPREARGFTLASAYAAPEPAAPASQPLGDIAITSPKPIREQAVALIKPAHKSTQRPFDEPPKPQAVATAEPVPETAVAPAKSTHEPIRPPFKPTAKPRALTIREKLWGTGPVRVASLTPFAAMRDS